ncbi:MAG: PIG-L family deacetylase [Patescibacteria group bacterium]
MPKENKPQKPFLFRGRFPSAPFWISSLVSLLAYGFYAWRYEVLPQAAASLLDDVTPADARDRILVFSPHQDDETIAVGGYIIESIERGAQVWIALITNGNKYGFEIKRYREFYSATEILGVPHDNLLFLDFKDGSLARQDKKIVQKKFTEVINQVKPTVIFAPHPKDAHADHAVTGTMARIAAGKRKLRFYRYLVHHPLFPKPRNLNTGVFLLPPVRLVRLDERWGKYVLQPGTIDKKLQAVLQYKSQLRIPLLNDLLLGLVKQNELFAATVEEED